MDCLFCRIARGEAPSEKVYEDPSVLAFKDIRPRAPVHLLIVPRKHIETLLEIGEADTELIGHVLRVAASLARDHGVAESGFRVVVNCGPAAGQSVYHIHFHLLGGRALSWPPG
jgi:histidine triad (HIT) family protein